MMAVLGGPATPSPKVAAFGPVRSKRAMAKEAAEHGGTPLGKPFAELGGVSPGPRRTSRAPTVNKALIDDDFDEDSPGHLDVLE